VPTISLDPDHLSGLIGDAYEAALEPAGWSRFLRRAESAFGSNLAVFSVFDHTESERSFAATYGIDETTADQFRQHHGGPGDFWWQRLKEAPAGSVHNIIESITRDEMQRSPLYADIAGPRDYEHFLGSVVIRSREVSAYLYLVRSRGQRDFESADRSAIASQLLPHLGRSLLLSRELSRLRTTRAALWAALDHSPYAIVILDSRSKPLFVNRRAGELFSAGDGLTMRRGRLVVPRPDVQVRLDWCTEVCLQIARGTIATPPPVLEIARPSGAPSLHVLACPIILPDEQPGMPTGSACMLLIRPASATLLLATDVLAQVYSLTPAELRLCQALLEKGSLTAAAGQVHVSRNTAKTQLRSIFRKTGARTQIELLRLLTPWSRSLFR